VHSILLLGPGRRGHSWAIGLGGCHILWVGLRTTIAGVMAVAVALSTVCTVLGFMVPFLCLVSGKEFPAGG